MKALILENKVVDTAEVEFEVSSALSWIDCPDDCNTEWTLIDGVLTAPTERPPLTYAEKRASAYDSIGDQLDMIYKDNLNGTTTHKESVEAVKAKYPKPS
jgi:hypothetical protein